MISIAIINLKGGVGKSVTACNLAAELAAKSKSVLVVDLDKQGNTSKFFGVADYDRPCVSSVLLGVARARDTIVQTAIPAVALLPCDMRMLKANREMIQDTGPRQFYLRNCLEPVEGKYDYCLIIAVDDLARFSGHVNGFQYRECFAVRLGPNGERAGRDGDVNALDWYKRWYNPGAGIEGYIAEDIERSEKK